MLYNLNKRRIRRIKRALKFYLFILFICALAAISLVFVTDVITVKVPQTIEQLENKHIRDTAERATGRKIDDDTVKEIKKTYQESEKKKH